MDNNGTMPDDTTERELLDLLHQKEPLVMQLQEIESNLAHIKDEIRGHAGKRIGDKEYARLMSQQEKWKRRKAEIMPALQQIKNRMRELGHTKRTAFEQQFLQRSVEDLAPLVRDLGQLRIYYQEFAADGSRVNSMRRMAAEFALKLDQLIRRTVREGIVRSAQVYDTAQACALDETDAGAHE